MNAAELPAWHAPSTRKSKAITIVLFLNEIHDFLNLNEAIYFHATYASKLKPTILLSHSKKIQKCSFTLTLKEAYFLFVFQQYLRSFHDVIVAHHLVSQCT